MKIILAIIAILIVIFLGIWIFGDRSDTTGNNATTTATTTNATSSATTTDDGTVGTTTSEGIDVNIYMVALEDNGVSGKKIGCGDSIVPVKQTVHTTGVMRAALDKLFAQKSQYYGQSGLYNALYQSNLKVESARIEGGVAHVAITGTTMLGGECDDPRVIAQIRETVMQFPTVTAADITVNGEPIDDYFSLK